jgi:hypothetical protein
MATFITAAVRTSNTMHCTSVWFNITEGQDGRMVGRPWLLLSINETYNNTVSAALINENALSHDCEHE